jgi:undecaprenyl-diphosphatase
MPVWHAVLLGVVQGLTEFLPISSTAHLLVARQLLGHPHPEDAFTVVVQLGTLVAVFWYFRTDIAEILRDVWTGGPGRRLGWLIVLGTVPGGLAGLFLKKWLKATFYNVPAMAIVAIVFGLLMAAAEWWAARRQRLGTPGREAGQITTADAVWVGLWQALALMPGGSRSGCTITGGLFAGLTRPAAAQFSFLLSLPIMLAAGLKELSDEYQKLKAAAEGEPPSLFASGDQVTALVVGTLVAAVVGYLSIAWLLRFLQRSSTGVFVVYRLVLGAGLLALVANGVLSAGK